VQILEPNKSESDNNPQPFGRAQVLAERKRSDIKIKILKIRESLSGNDHVLGNFSHGPRKLLPFQVGFFQREHDENANSY
jgi:hypothetical protein